MMDHSQRVRTMFNQVAPSYDRINTILSFGLDRYWRRKVAKLLPASQIQVLDLACGSGVLMQSILKHTPHTVTGLDPSEEMLGVAKEKLKDQARVHDLVAGYAEDLPFDTDSIDAITMGFGIRNTTDTAKALSEIYRVLKPGGTALILEFSLPKNRLIQSIFRFYLNNLLPHVGGFLSGDTDAYRYLARTIQTFPSGGRFLSLLHDAGFNLPTAHPLTFGTVTIYEAQK